jgi:DNA processing protein
MTNDLKQNIASVHSERALSCHTIELLTQSSLPKYFPQSVFYSGNETLLEMPRVAIVGSRHPTLYGRQLAVRFSSFLSQAGVCIVSGGALGIDFIATKVAMEKGNSIVVIGGGLNCPHPASHASFFERISLSEHGLVLSQFGSNERAAPWHFPKRNLTLALLSEFVLIIEAGEKSGSLITARAALDYGIDLGAIPGDINSPMSKGTNALISEGAFCIREPEEVLERVINLRALKRIRSSRASHSCLDSSFRIEVPDQKRGQPMF